MATKKIKELAELSIPGDADVFVIEDAAATKRISFQNVFNRIKAKLGVAAGYAVADNLITSTGDSVLHAKQGKALQETKAPNNHASNGTTYGVGNASQHGHVMASSTAPLVAGTATAGIDNGKYAREGHVHQMQTTVTGNAGSATKLATARRIDGVDFDGSGDIGHYAVCSTAGGTTAKVVTLNGFVLTTGARVTVKFTSEITVANATLNVSSTGAKALNYKGGLLPANYISANTIVELVFDGTVWIVQGELIAELYSRTVKTVTYSFPTGTTILPGKNAVITTSIAAGGNIINASVYAGGGAHTLDYGGFSGATNINIVNLGTQTITPGTNWKVHVFYI